MIKFQLKSKDGREEVVRLQFIHTDDSVDTSYECIQKIWKILNDYFEKNIHEDNMQHTYTCTVVIADTMYAARHSSEFGVEAMGWFDMGKSEYYYHIGAGNKSDFSNINLVLAFYKL